MTKQELIENLQKLTFREFYEVIECAKQEIEKRLKPTAADMKWARETLEKMSPRDHPAGTDPDDFNLPLFGNGNK